MKVNPNIIHNSKADIFYGMHFYPGVAEYSDGADGAYRIFINEATMRKMDPTFAGCPIFVEHVDEVNSNLDEVKKDADGWVIESFFNQADGKHWVKFAVVSERGKAAIKNGYRLSNAYVPTGFANGGLWNGVTYAKEVTGGEFEHLAIVRNPRYEESEIMTPEKFKKYNDDQQVELKRLANSKENSMKLSFFKKEKVENAVDFETMSVTLPKSGKEKSLLQLVNELDEVLVKGDLIEVGDKKMKQADLVKAYLNAKDEVEKMKKENEEKDEDESEVDMEKKKVKVEGDKHNEEDEDEDMDDKVAKKKKENEEDDEDEDEEMMNKKKKNKKKMNSSDDKEFAAAKKKYFDMLKNAQDNASDETAHVEVMQDGVARGKDRY